MKFTEPRINTIQFTYGRDEKLSGVTIHYTRAVVAPKGETVAPFNAEQIIEDAKPLASYRRMVANLVAMITAGDKP